MYNVNNKNIKQKKHTPIRMCITCRKRIKQKDLVKLKCVNKQIVTDVSIARSFYICRDCLRVDNKNKCLKSLQRYCKTEKEQILKWLNCIIEGEDI